MAAFDPLRIIGVLNECGVRYVVIGGLAATAHGSPSITMDLDICYDRRPENLAFLVRALRALHAQLRGAPKDVPFRLDAETIAAGDHFTFATVAGDLDCLGTPGGTEGFEDLAANAEAKDFDGVRALVASIDDLIRMKRAAGRPKDLVEIEILGALRDEILGHRNETPS